MPATQEVHSRPYTTHVVWRGGVRLLSEILGAHLATEFYWVFCIFGSELRSRLGGLHAMCLKY